MVIAKILSVLFPTLQCRSLVAVHIDYANREESNREAIFVKEWSERHGFQFHIRVVNEVTRGITDRSEYEKISRQIRYNFYKDVLSKGRKENSCNLADEPNVGIIFGHHIGDIQENVISNIMR
jgi:tRNA(Ile)-lysidine synthase TilS/MesJ